MNEQHRCCPYKVEVAIGVNLWSYLYYIPYRPVEGEQLAQKNAMRPCGIPEIEARRKWNARVAGKGRDRRIEPRIEMALCYNLRSVIVALSSRG